MNTNRITVVHAVAGLITAVATCFIAKAYFSQIDIMKGTLEVLNNTLETEISPKVKLSLHSNMGDGNEVKYEETEEGGERWIMPYYVGNLGDKTAYKIRYYHELSKSDIIDKPGDDKYQMMHYKKDL